MPSYRAFEAIGTHWQIDTDRPLSPAEWARVDERIEDFDRTYSRFRADSLVAKVAAGAGVFEFPDDCRPLIAWYRRLYDLTAGAVTPLVGGTLEDLGYDPAYRLTPMAAVRPTPVWDEVTSWQGTTLHTREPVVLDVGAAGKGYLVDILGELLTGLDVRSFVIDASGDLLHRGPDTLRVGLEHPTDAGQVIGVATLGNAALAASAANRRTWGSADRVLHHIIDPHSGEPVRQIIAGWVIADSAMVADGLATALFFADAGALETIEAEFGAGWLRVTGSGSAHWSPSFKGELFR